jgi:hypothetical protein
LERSKIFDEAPGGRALIRAPPERGHVMRFLAGGLSRGAQARLSVISNCSAGAQARRNVISNARPSISVDSV